MGSVAATKKAISSALGVINSAIGERRLLSEFERARLMKLLDSIQRQNNTAEFHLLAACYYSLDSDVDNLIYHANKVISGGVVNGKIVGNEKIVKNAIIALSNSLMIREVYNVMKKYHLPDELLDEYMSRLFMCTSLFMNDLSGYSCIKKQYEYRYKNDIEHVDIHRMNKLYDFFYKNESDGDSISSYICDVFEIISRKISKKAISVLNMPQISDYDFETHNDDGYEFVSISFLFPYDSSADIVFDLEDEMLRLISHLNYPHEIKTKISFDFTINPEE
ncbi:TPA: hypothetical protein SMP49_003444 [Proteus mirabilis]|nr:hypothetical protein [Proteus mirabilis]